MVARAYWSRAKLPKGAFLQRRCGRGEGDERWRWAGMVVHCGWEELYRGEGLFSR